MSLGVWLSDMAMKYIAGSLEAKSQLYAAAITSKWIGLWMHQWTTLWILYLWMLVLWLYCGSIAHHVHHIGSLCCQYPVIYPLKGCFLPPHLTPPYPTPARPTAGGGGGGGWGGGWYNCLSSRSDACLPTQYSCHSLIEFVGRMRIACTCPNKGGLGPGGRGHGGQHDLGHGCVVMSEDTAPPLAV